MNNRVKKILGKVLNIEFENFKDEDINPNNIIEWDSLVNLNILISLEEEFNIEISPEEIAEMFEGYNTIVEILKNHGVDDI